MGCDREARSVQIHGRKWWFLSRACTLLGNGEALSRAQQQEPACCCQHHVLYFGSGLPGAEDVASNLSPKAPGQQHQSCWPLVQASTAIRWEIHIAKLMGLWHSAPCPSLSNEFTHGMGEGRRGRAMLVAVSEAKLNGMGGNDHNCLIRLASAEQLDTNLLPIIPT